MKSWKDYHRVYIPKNLEKLHHVKRRTLPLSIRVWQLSSMLLITLLIHHFIYFDLSVDIYVDIQCASATLDVEKAEARVIGTI